jgi:hypothetical protein
MIYTITKENSDTAGPTRKEAITPLKFVLPYIPASPLLISQPVAKGFRQ